jgi:hypothetical protein
VSRQKPRLKDCLRKRFQFYNFCCALFILNRDPDFYASLQLMVGNSRYPYSILGQGGHGTNQIYDRVI